MQRLTTVLYPSIPSSGSEGSLVNRTSQDSARAVSPGASAPPPIMDPQYPLAMASKSIYDDPRTTVFPSPSVPRSQSDIQHTYASVVTSASSSAVSSRRPSLVRRLTDEALSAATGKRTSSPGPSLLRLDRGLRVNLMQSGQGSKGKTRTGTPAPAYGGRLTSMAKGPAGRYVVGGGQYLRVLEITNPVDPDAPKPTSKQSGRQAGHPFARGHGGTAISEVVNFWKGSWAIGKGVNDVDWGVSNFENKIVTATPSGNFMIFDVNRGKLERETSGGHPRPMNCIRFSRIPSSAYLLITGGTEGQVRLWDMRDSEPTSRKFYKHNAPVTALTASPDDPHSFVVGTEAGGLFRYDYRVQNKNVGKVWGAHGSKPVLDLKWKVADEDNNVGPGKGWLASAGSDRTVQIWDMGQTWDKGAAAAHVLHTAHQVRCVDWHPTHPTELVVVPFDHVTAPAGDPTRPAETTLDESDSALEVWDVRRHYVAKYALPGIEGNAVSAIWDDNDALVACYQNGSLAQIDLNSKTAPKTYPLESIPRQMSACSVKGELAYALDRFKLGEIPFDDIKTEFASWQVGGHRQRKGIADAPYEPLQTTGVVPLPENDEDEFIYIAQQLRLEGDVPEKLCRWNREISEICGRYDEARIWDHLQGLIEEFGKAPDGLFNEGVFSQAITGSPLVRVSSPKGAEEQSRPQTPPYANIIGVSLERAPDMIGEDEMREEDEDRSSSSSTESSQGPQTPPRRSRFKGFVPPTLSAPPALRPSLGPRESSSYMGSYHGLITRTKKLTIDAPAEEDTPTPTADMDYPDPYGIAAALESVTASMPGRSGGYTSRSTPHSTRPPTPSMGTKALPGRISGHVTPNSGSARPSVVAANMDRLQPAAITRRAHESYTPDQWDAYRLARCTTFLDWWQAYVDDGEVQIATALYMVGEGVVDFPPKQAHRVLDAYIDILERYHLAVPVAYIRRFTSILDVQTLPGQDGITHILHCSKCGKSTGSLEDTADKKSFWWCTKCKRAAKLCVVCREPVHGLFMGCHKCMHGGHHRCMRLYYLETEQTEDLPQSSTLSRAASPLPPVRRTSAQPNGVQAETSLDSNITERTDKDSNATAPDGDRQIVHTNTCPTGCGCRCRFVGPS